MVLPTVQEVADALIRCAKARPLRLSTYDDFGRKEFGLIGRQIGTKKLLDGVAEYLTSIGHPNVTFMLKSAKYGYPSQIDMCPAKPPNAKQKLYARTEMEKIIEFYGLSDPNPYP